MGTVGHTEMAEGLAPRVGTALVIAVLVMTGCALPTSAAVAAPNAGAQPARFVEPFGSGVTVGLAVGCPQPPQHVVATVSWSNSSPRTLTAATCSNNPREDGDDEELKGDGLNVDILTNPAQWGPPEAYPVGPRLGVEAAPVRHHAKWVISFQLAVGTYIDSGTIFMYPGKYEPARRVWQGEQLFGTVCIDMHKKITSIDHRRGCYTPPELFTTEKVQWAHSTSG